MASEQSQQASTFDPEPLSLAISMIGALAPFGILIAERAWEALEEHRERRKAIGDKIYDTHRAVNQVERILKDLVGYLDQQGYLDREFALGRAPLQGDEEMIIRVNRLYDDIYQVGARLNDAVVGLSQLMDEEDAYQCRKFADELDSHLHTALRASYYREFVVATSRLIGEARSLLAALGERYDIRPPEYHL
jgi:hypothetical protein